MKEFGLYTPEGFESKEEIMRKLSPERGEKVGDRFVKHVIGGDLHAPDHNPQAVDLFEQFIKDYKPDVLHLSGDIVNCTPISKFLVVDYKKTLNDELNVARDVFYHIVDTARKANKNVDIYYEAGNHEARLSKFLWRSAAQLTDLEDADGEPILTIEHLFSLKENGINYIPPGQVYRIGDFIVKHGEKTGVKAGYAAHKNIEQNFTDGASGHTHRLGVVTRKMGNDVKVWGEYGCLCNLQPTPDYIGGSTDWVNGFGFVVYDKKTKLTHPVPIIIRKDQFYFNDKLYEAE